MQPGSPRGIALPKGHTASTLFHAVLAEAVTRFPDELRGVGLPEDPKVWKRTYGKVLARFEAARAVTSRREEIARFIVSATQAALQYAIDDQHTPLTEHLRMRAPAPKLETTVLGREPGLRVEVPFSGKVYRGMQVRDLAAQLAVGHDMTSGACTGLGWMAQRAAQSDGVIDLRGQRFVLLGAAAELAPTRMLLQAGASVLWIDLTEPSAAALGDESKLSGTLVRVPGAGNLLEAPREVVAAITRFAQDGPVNIGMFAYASGGSQEWRLGAAMTAIVTQLDPALVGSVSLLVSPTTAPVLDAESVVEARARLARRPMWQSALLRSGILTGPGSYEEHGVNVGLSTVSIQGLSYQAAQYISKLVVAETFARGGIDLQSESPRPLTVSANVAGITRTRSLSHPVFQAAFIGAPRFSVRIFEPETTRALSGLLMLHDLLNPEAPGAVGVQPGDARDKARKLFSQKIHGGIYALPYELESAIRVAAVIGMGVRPSLMLRRGGSSRRERAVLSAHA